MEKRIKDLFDRCEAAGVTLAVSSQGAGFVASPAIAITALLRGSLEAERAEVLAVLRDREQEPRKGCGACIMCGRPGWDTTLDEDALCREHLDVHYLKLWPVVGDAEVLRVAAERRRAADAARPAWMPEGRLFG